MFPVQLLPQALPFYIRHHVEQERVCFTRVEQRQDIRVTEVRGRPDLGQETLGSDDCREFWPDVARSCGGFYSTGSLLASRPAPLRRLIPTRGTGD